MEEILTMEMPKDLLEKILNSIKHGKTIEKALIEAYSKGYEKGSYDEGAYYRPILETMQQEINTAWH